MIRLRNAGAALFVAAAVWPSHAQADPEGASADAQAADPLATKPSASLPTTGTNPATASDPLPLPAPAPPPRFPQHFLFSNGLSLLLTSLSVGYELLPVPHHSLGVNLHGQYGGGVVSGIAGVKGAFVGVGGELGYRFYAWRDGPFGPFFGLSFLTGYYHTQATVYAIDPNAFRYLQYGPAVDFGWSIHLDRTTVLALGIGAQYTFVDVDPRRLNELTRLLVGDGPRPRGRIQVGKTF